MMRLANYIVVDRTIVHLSEEMHRVSNAAVLGLPRIGERRDVG